MLRRQFPGTRPRANTLAKSPTNSSAARMRETMPRPGTYRRADGPVARRMATVAESCGITADHPAGRWKTRRLARGNDVPVAGTGISLEFFVHRFGDLDRARQTGVGHDAGSLDRLAPEGERTLFGTHEATDRRADVDADPKRQWCLVPGEQGFADRPDTQRELGEALNGRFGVLGRVDGGDDLVAEEFEVADLVLRRRPSAVRATAGRRRSGRRIARRARPAPSHRSDVATSPPAAL